MKKKGYTLIELLAVIVILAIIALIVVPVIGDLIKNARLAAFRTSMYGIINSADTYINTYDITHDDELIYPYEFVCDGRACAINDDALEFKGKVPIGGKVVIKNGGTLIDYVTDGTFCAYGYKWNLEIVDECEDVPTDYAGLYDAEDNLVADWNTLVTKYGFVIDKDYSIQYMEEGPFNEGDNLRYILENNSELSEGVKLIISNSVAYIGEYAVAETEQLKSVIIPDSVITIGANAFRWNDIDNLVIGNNVETINASAFDSINVSELIIPDSVKFIGDSAFASNISLTTLVIGSGIETIEYYAFGSCEELKNVTLNGGSDFADGIFSYDDYIENITINGVTDASLAMFYPNNSLVSATFGNGVETIVSGCSYCDGLTTVTMADSVRVIGSEAFSNSTNLTSITLPANLEVIGNSAFNNTGITEVTLPNHVTSIGEYAFTGTGISEIVLPDTVTSIGEYAFAGTGISELIIPDSVTSLGKYVCDGCSNLTTLVIGSGIGDITDIGSGMDYLVDLTIKGDGTTSFGGFGADLDYTESVTLGDGVIEIGEYAFQGCDSLKIVVLGDGITTIPQAAFSGLTNLENVTFGDYVDTIEDAAFYGCSSIQNMVIPTTVTSIGDSAFADCDWIDELEIWPNLTTIGSSAFAGTNITSIHIPNTVSSLGYSVFDGCNNLETVIVDIPAYGDFLGSAYNNIKNLTLNYNGEISWREWNDMQSLENLTIGSGITGIGYNTFQSCYNLKNVTINEGIEYIRNGVFDNSSSLESLTIPNSVTHLWSDVCAGCTGLKEVRIGNGVTELDHFAVDSTNLEYAYIGTSVTNIDYLSFGGGSALKGITFTDTSKQWYYYGEDPTYENPTIEVKFNVTDSATNAAKFKLAVSNDSAIYKLSD